MSNTKPNWLKDLLPLFADPAGTTWRTGVLSESLGDTAFNDPDFDAFKPPKYSAVRTQRWLYVEYVDGSRELFDRQADPAEIHNRFDDPQAAALDQVFDVGQRLANRLVDAFTADDLLGQIFSRFCIGK